MNKKMPHDRLMRVIAKEAKANMGARQVADRLKNLFATRLRDLKRSHSTDTVRGAAAERLALSDPRYESLVEELIEMRAEAHRARVAYETHNMLYQARQSLRALHATRG